MQRYKFISLSASPSNTNQKSQRQCHLKINKLDKPLHDKIKTNANGRIAIKGHYSRSFYFKTQKFQTPLRPQAIHSLFRRILCGDYRFPRSIDFLKIHKHHLRKSLKTSNGFQMKVTNFEVCSLLFEEKIVSLQRLLTKSDH